MELLFSVPGGFRRRQQDFVFSVEDEALWRSPTYEPGLDFDLKRQHDADDAIVPGNCQ